MVDAEALRWVTAQETARAVTDGELSPREAVGGALERAEGARPLNAFVELRPSDALAHADRVLRRIAAGERLPLAGVPFAVKDVTDLEGWPTGHGVGATRVARASHPGVQRLLDAGAVPIGKTTTSELALWPQTATPSTGTTRNPHDLSRTPGGSSGGSAAVVAAGVVPFATATDGGGSIRIPAAHCGVLGLKDARGRAPGPEHWRGLTTAGVHVRAWQDLLLVHGVLVDAEAGPIAATARRFGRLTGLGTTCDPAVERAVDAVCEHLRTHGHTVEPVQASRELRRAARAFSVLIAAGARDDLRRLGRPALTPTTARFLHLARAAPPLADRQRRVAATAATRLQQAFADLDALIMPTTPTAAAALRAPWERRLPDLLRASAASSSWTSPFNALGWAALSVPTGAGSGLPIGVQFVSPHDDGLTLTRLIASLGLPERSTGAPA